MKNRQFDIMFGYLGNGTTVYNRLREENGDYETVAHISPAGNIKWYVSKTKLSEIGRKQIERVAKQNTEKFLAWFDTLSEIRKYDYLLKRTTVSEMLDVFNMDAPLQEKIAQLWETVSPCL